MSVKISGEKYAMMYGPTVGDKVRLADTSLVIEVEKDYTTYGDEVKFGGGKTIRDGMGQSVKTCSRDGDLDLVITNALIVDATGIVKADIGIKDGKISLSMKALEEVKEEPAEQKKGKLAYIPDVEEMKAMTVDKLRALARKLEITNMTRKEIRFANKTELIERILEFLEKENK